MGLQSFLIPNKAMTSNSEYDQTTPAAAGRLYLTAGQSLGLGGAWCAKNETQVSMIIKFFSH